MNQDEATGYAIIGVTLLVFTALWLAIGINSGFIG
jgi:hypothetical protein